MPVLPVGDITEAFWDVHRTSIVWLDTPMKNADCTHFCYAPALVEAFYPSAHGAEALADVLFGAVAPSGRMPYTTPRAAFVDEVDFLDYNMSSDGGKTVKNPMALATGTGVQQNPMLADGDLESSEEEDEQEEVVEIEPVETIIMNQKGKGKITENPMTSATSN